jgi:hypothetical protein
LSQPVRVARVVAGAHFLGEIRVEVVPERGITPKLEAGGVPGLVSLEARELASEQALHPQLRKSGFLQLGRTSQHFVSEQVELLEVVGVVKRAGSPQGTFYLITTDKRRLFQVLWCTELHERVWNCDAASLVLEVLDDGEECASRHRSPV